MANKKNKNGGKRAVSKQKEKSGGVFKRLRSKLASSSPKGKDVEDVVMSTPSVQAVTSMVVDASMADDTAVTVDATMTVEDLFLEELCDRDDPDVMGLEGISKFCESVLKIDPFEDVRALVFLWKIKATAKPGQIAKTEWTKGCANLDLATCGDLEECLPKLDPNLLTDEEFKDFYKFCFQFNREGASKLLDKELVIMLVKMVLKNNKDRVCTVERLAAFAAFLEASEDYQKVKLDEWTSFYEFSLEVKDLSEYVDDGSLAWPVMIDDFVDYLEKQKEEK